MKVPFVDLLKQYQSIKAHVDSAIHNVIHETAFIGGKYVDEFEKEFALLYGVKNCISVANGTDSLFIIMKMLGIGPGDEVITSAHSWISSSETISQTGATPIFIDTLPGYFTIDPKLIVEKITSRTKAILPVHLYGQMCNIVEIEEICREKGLYLIEDCAQSHFSEFNGIRAGLNGIAGSFSFYPGKNLGAYGDAGCIITNDDELAFKCRMYARHGAIVKHRHMIEGINSRMDGVQAAILTAKLPYILKWTDMRIKNADTYNNLLKGISNIELPSIYPNTSHTFHLYVILAENRNELMEYLKGKGIETAIHYPNILPNLDAYKYLNYSIDDFPVANSYQSRILSLPMFPELDLEQINYVCESIKSFYKC